MKAIEKINLIRNIAEKIDKDFKDESEIEYFLESHGFSQGYFAYQEHEVGYNQREMFLSIKGTLLKTQNEDILKNIADELDISQNLSSLIKKYPENWVNNNNLKLFISHSHKNEESATKLRTALIDYKIDAFVAHKDINPTKNWREQIKFALNTMDFFISLNTKYFNESQFCQQELGFAISRNVDIIQLIFKKNKDNLPRGLGEEIQCYVSKNLVETVSKIVNVARNSNKIGELYNKINPIGIEKEDDDEIPF